MDEKEYKWKEEDTVIDYTDTAKKIWDEMMPKTYPHIKKFITKGVKEVEGRDKLGPYHMDYHKMIYSVFVEIDAEPMRRIGWTPKEKITKEIWQKAYGKDYFNEMRHRMRELIGYLGLKFSNFDFKGDVDAKTSD